MLLKVLLVMFILGMGLVSLMLLLGHAGFAERIGKWAFYILTTFVIVEFLYEKKN